AEAGLLILDDRERRIGGATQLVALEVEQVPVFVTAADHIVHLTDAGHGRGRAVAHLHDLIREHRRVPGPGAGDLEVTRTVVGHLGVEPQLPDAALHPDRYVVRD